MSSDDEFSMRVRRNKFIPIPPKERNFATPNFELFLEDGITQVNYLRKHGLKEGSSLLEVGSGIGRLALPLTQFLTEDGNYVGLDINISGVSWCHENISTKYSNFTFSVINAFNKNYKNKHELGQDSFMRASWPVPNHHEFDMSCAFSVFTHLLRDESEHMLSEISKRLKKDGKLISTWFLMNEDSKLGVENGTARWGFDLSGPGPDYLVDQQYSEAIGHDQKSISEYAESIGLKVVSVRYSGWHNGEKGQDILVFQKS